MDGEAGHREGAGGGEAGHRGEAGRRGGAGGGEAQKAEEEMENEESGNEEVEDEVEEFKLVRKDAEFLIICMDEKIHCSSEVQKKYWADSSMKTIPPSKKGISIMTADFAELHGGLVKQERRVEEEEGSEEEEGEAAAGEEEDEEEEKGESEVRVGGRTAWVVGAGVRGGAGAKKRRKEHETRGGGKDEKGRRGMDKEAKQLLQDKAGAVLDTDRGQYYSSEHFLRDCSKVC